MINKYDRLANQLLSVIYIDRNDPTLVKVGFDSALKIFDKFDIIVPPKAYELTLTKVIEGRLVGKLAANDTAKWVIAQAMINTALALSLTKEDITKMHLRDDMQKFVKKK